MLTRLDNERGGGLARVALGDDVACAERPAGESAFKGGIPGAETELWGSVGGEVRVGVVKKAGAANNLGVGSDGKSEEFDGIREGWGEIEFCRRGHGRRLECGGTAGNGPRRTL